MVNLVDLVRIGENSCRAVGYYRVRFPGIPELIANLHVLFHSLVPARPFRHFYAISVPFALGIGANDVPSNASSGQVVETRKSADHRIGMFERCGQSDAYP